MPQRNTMHFLCLRGESFVSTSLSRPPALRRREEGTQWVGGIVSSWHCRQKGGRGKKKRERSTRNRRQSRGRFLFLSFTLGLSLCFFPFFASSLPLAHRCFVKKSARGPRTLGGYEKGVAVVVLACVRMCRLKPRTAHVTQDRRQRTFQAIPGVRLESRGVGGGHRLSRACWRLSTA